MKLIINYDLISKTKEAKDTYVLTRIRKNFKKVSYWYGIYVTINLSLGQRIEQAIGNAAFSASFLFTLFSIMDFIKYKTLGDIDKAKAIFDLIKLSIQLGQSNISTSVDLLLDSEEYETKYKIKINEKKLPYVLQEKYIMVPTYNNGEIKETSILQEHVMGSKVYVLSLGSPTKAFKPALATM